MGGKFLQIQEDIFAAGQLDLPENVRAISEKLRQYLNLIS
jgi:hypothetical protein